MLAVTEIKIIIKIKKKYILYTSEYIFAKRWREEECKYKNNNSLPSIFNLFFSSNRVFPPFNLA
jgi:hypothetical protein